MKTKKHTKGPWRVEADQVVSVANANGDWPVVAKRCVYNPENWDADARLIALAPEMHSMLKRLATISTLNEKWDIELQYMLARIEGKIK